MKIWPMIWSKKEDGAFATIGAVVALVGDFASFLEKLPLTRWIIWPALLLTVALGMVCYRKMREELKSPVLASATGPACEQKDEQCKGDPSTRSKAVGNCRQCNGFRVTFFTALSVALLMLASGSKETFAEQAATRLGVIEEKVDAVKEDTGVIRDDVGVLRESMAIHELIRNPKTAEEYFHNVWAYLNVRQDDAKAWEVVQEMYRHHAPNKLDAAQLYEQLGGIHLGAAETHRRMLAVGREKQDAAMLVVASRAADGESATWALLNEARAMDPEMPHAAWDIGNYRLGRYVTSKASTLNESTHYLQQIEQKGLEAFLKLAESKPPASYFFRPRFSGDSEQLVRMRLEGIRELAQIKEQNRKAVEQSQARLRDGMRRQNEELERRARERRQRQ
ncbi:membrane hypothetical protein [uncultured Stenotrophomonas sp.]|uniref:Transmembrane protein n=1 Tax=uncultured Stenotrophomonas sp. TaxID=165438 RepID=A0A1Y5PZA2_9GAMM|nr:membrane hypothetical protein [uncultured Stenotrophomonas sp.]